VIRQAISCDVCGTDKKETNHWFVAYEHGSELRISGWSSPHRLHARSRHLCGQTCLHKLIDEFFARTLAASAALPDQDPTRADPEVKDLSLARTDASLTSRVAHPFVSSRLPKFPGLGIDQSESSAWPMAPASRDSISADSIPAADPPASPTGFNTKAWRAEAWKREKERAQRTSLSNDDKRRRSTA
jgi:hypothetical protein